MKKKETVQEILEPDAKNSEPATNSLVPGKHPDRVTLVTPGQVKSEMGRIYRAVLKGKLNPLIGKILVRDHLTPILKATEIEQQFNLAMDDPDDDRPALVGLQITGPAPKLQDGAAAREMPAANDEAKKITRKKGKDHDDESTA